MGGPKTFSLTAALRGEYERLFSSCKPRKDKRALIESAAAKVHAQKARYQALEPLTTVPWYVVGAIHSMESGQRFDRHLHNGDLLTSRTTHVPRERPPGAPPFSWEQSAMDALQLDGFTGWDDWSVAGMLFKLEAFNGLGYRLHHPTVKSPYLWSFTNHYGKGKYGADGKFDASLVSKQVGVAALLRALDELGLAKLPKAPAPRRGPGRGVRDVPVIAPPPPYPGHVVRRGEPNRGLVLAIQKRLVLLGCGPIAEDGELGGDTEASLKLFQARSVDNRGAPLGVDGAVGPLTWEALFGTRTITVTEASAAEDPLLAKALAIAAVEVGVAEDPPNSNRGKRVESYLASVGLGGGFAWCAAFVHWCFREASKSLGVDDPVVKTAGCLVHWLEAGKRGVRRIMSAHANEDPSLVQPGHVFIMDYGGGKGHTGLVEHVQGGMLITIEGNTNPEGGREGGGVYRRTQRKISDINVGFIDYSARRISSPAAPSGGAAPVVSVPAAELAEIAPLSLGKSARGLLREAVALGEHEPPVWKEVELDGLIVRVGAHALRANVGGRLLRLPVSYRETIEIANALAWAPATSALSDAIWRAATVRLPPAAQGDWSTPAASKVTSQKMSTLEFVLKHDDAIEKRIPLGRRHELASSEGKDWILSKRNLTAPRAATTYGWHIEDGKPIQGLGPDGKVPAHDDAHFDYSQTLRPIQRKARRKSDGVEVDLLDELEKRGMPAAVLAPLRTRGVPRARPSPRTKASRPALRRA